MPVAVDKPIQPSRAVDAAKLVVCHDLPRPTPKATQPWHAVPVRVIGTAQTVCPRWLNGHPCSVRLVPSRPLRRASRQRISSAETELYVRLIGILHVATRFTHRKRSNMSCRAHFAIGLDRVVVVHSRAIRALGTETSTACLQCRALQTRRLIDIWQCAVTTGYTFGRRWKADIAFWAPVAAGVVLIWYQPSPTHQTLQPVWALELNP